MAAKSIWKGVIQFSLISIPVKVYNALERSENISFNQLHAECLGPIGYEKRCKKCGQVATNEQIVKGYQHEKDQYTVIDPEEIKKITPASNEAITITGFMKATEIPTAYFDASYFATPEGAVAQQSYALLREVMKRTGLIAVAKVTLKEREELIAISPNETGLLIQKLHYRHEVRSITSMPGALKEETAVDAQQLDIAAQLVTSMMTSFDQLDTEDHFHTQLRKMLDDKIAGREITVTERATKQDNVVDIMEALKRSLAAKQTEAPAIDGLTEPSAETSTITEPPPLDASNSQSQTQQPLLSLVPEPPASSEKKSRRKRAA